MGQRPEGASAKCLLTLNSASNAWVICHLPTCFDDTLSPFVVCICSQKCFYHQNQTLLLIDVCL